VRATLAGPGGFPDFGRAVEETRVTLKPTPKPILKIGKYYCGRSDGLADFPMRLSRNRAGQYYWMMARSGEYHWWIVTVCSPEEQ
jgi:hypothetical protein